MAGAIGITRFSQLFAGPVEPYKLPLSTNRTGAISDEPRRRYRHCSELNRRTSQKHLFGDPKRISGQFESSDIKVLGKESTLTDKE